ncbi:MAG: Fic family protein [Firmicutes bacterium]|nr:Fic family protein [Bacillota bacterium]
MRKFDYSFLKNARLPVAILDYANGIAEIKALQDARKKSYKGIFSGLEAVAKVQSVKGSNAIEGIITTDKRIEEIVNKSSAPLNHNEAEIAGYRDALNLVHGGHETIDAREADILHLHNILLSYTNYSEKGQYKQSDNVILEVDALGNRRVRFSPTSAFETPKAMEQAVFAYLDARNNSSINQLLLIPCFILDFLCIHPFADGNGRISRLLSLLLLYKNGYDAGKYISFEEQINKCKDSYYEALKQSSIGWDKGENDYIPFIQSFVITLMLCYKELDKRFALFNEKKANKKQRIEATVLNSIMPISKSEIAYILPDISATTIEAVLSAMVKSGAIKKIGNNRSARYLRDKG